MQSTDRGPDRNRSASTAPNIGLVVTMWRVQFSSLLITIASIYSSLVIASEAFSPPSHSKTQKLLVHASTTMSDDSNMQSTYQSLADRLMERYLSSTDLQNNQLFVCVAGGPGSGKSTLSSAVAELINEKMMQNQDDGAEAAVVLPMDGFHYSRSQLQSMGESNTCQYTYEELLARRGAPWTFDAERCIAAFSAARKNGEANLPVYSRVKSDPVKNGVQLLETTKIVLLEGNYLLSYKDPRWAPLKDLFDETWYISCKSVSDQRQRLVLRHLETWSEEKTKMWGAGEEGAGAKADANDMLNAQWIDEMSREFADLIVESL